MRKRNVVLILVISLIVIALSVGSCATGNTDASKQTNTADRKQAEFAVTTFMSKLPTALLTDGDAEIRAYFDRNEGFEQLSEECLSCVNAALKRVTFTISEMTIEKDGLSARCRLSITDVDPEGMLSGFSGPKIPANDAKTLISKEDAILRTSDCAISLTKNRESNSWEVSDADELIELLIGSYTAHEYVRVDPVVSLLDFTKTLAEGKVYENDFCLAKPAKWELLYPEDSLPKFETAFFKATSYQVIEVSYNGDECVILTEIDYPDVYFVNTILASDQEILMSMHRAAILNFLTGDPVDLSETDRLADQKGVEFLLDPDTPHLTVKQSFRLVLAAGEKSWMVSGLPEVLTEKNYDFDESGEKQNIAAFYKALEQMLDKEEITEKTYKDILRRAGLDPVNTEITEDILSQDWVDVQTEQPVSDYVAAESNGIKYLLTFRSAWPDTKIYGAYYLDGGMRPIHEFERVLGKTDTTFSTCLVGTDTVTIPTGSYRLILTLVDGTILASADVEVR